MVRLSLGRFALTPIKTGTAGQPAYEVWGYGEYLGLLMQSPKTGKWAITHNMTINPESKDAADRYCWTKPSEAIKAHNRDIVNKDIDATSLDILPKTPDVVRRDDEKRTVDIEKLRRTANDPSKSEGVRNAAREKLKGMGYKL